MHNVECSKYRRYVEHSQCCAASGTNYFQDIFTSPEENPTPVRRSFPILCSPSPWQPQSALRLYDLLYSGDIYINMITQYVTFSDCPLSLSMMLWQEF